MKTPKGWEADREKAQKAGEASQGFHCDQRLRKQKQGIVGIVLIQDGREMHWALLQTC